MSIFQKIKEINKYRVLKIDRTSAPEDLAIVDDGVEYNVLQIEVFLLFLHGPLVTNPFIYSTY